MAKIITISGKGGVGKTTLTALLLDELGRSGYTGRVLAVDGDPATTLHLALGLAAPPATLADLREQTPLDARTLQALPPGMSPADYLKNRLLARAVIRPHHLHRMPLDLLSMGWGEGRPSCYCRINHLLAEVLGQLVGGYDLMVVDNEAGLEHLSRYRIKQVDLFLTVVTPDPTSQRVAEHALHLARSVGMALSESWTLFNRAVNGMTETVGETPVVCIPEGWQLEQLVTAGQVPVSLSPDDMIRKALRPVINRLLKLDERSQAERG